MSVSLTEWLQNFNQASTRRCVWQLAGVCPKQRDANCWLRMVSLVAWDFSQQKYTLSLFFNMHSETRRKPRKSCSRHEVLRLNFEKKHLLKISQKCNFLEPPWCSHRTVLDGSFHSRSWLRPRMWGSASDCLMVCPRTLEEVTRGSGWLITDRAKSTFSEKNLYRYKSVHQKSAETEPMIQWLRCVTWS